MSGATLSPAMRSMLLSLQSTAAQTASIQTRLATGRKVNTALDNPGSFFTSLALSARASDLNALVDNIGQAQQAVKTVSQSLSSLTKLVQAAQSIAHQARLSPLPQVSYGAIEQVGSTNIGGESAGSVTGNVDTSGGFVADVDGLQIQVGATTVTVHPPTSPGAVGINAIISAINNTAGLGNSGAVKASLDPSGKFIKLSANSTDTSFQVVASGVAAALGISGLSGTSTNLLQAVSGLSGTSLTVRASGGIAKTVTFGSGGSQVSTFAELQSALGISGATVSLNGSNLSLAVDASSGQPNSLTTSGSALAVLGLPAAHTEFGAVGATNPDASRASYQTQYNNIVQQLDTLAQDSSYGGINLLKGEDLSAAFNENGTSALTISGVSLDAAGLGLAPLTGDDLQSNAVVDDVLAKLDAALAALRAQASRFGSSLSLLQTRQDFTKALVNALQTGASDLVLADTNQEGANLLALQTRHDLSVTALSLAAQGDNSILRLLL